MHLCLMKVFLALCLIPILFSQFTVATISSEQALAFRNGNSLLIRMGGEFAFNSKALLFEPSFSWLGGRSELVESSSAAKATYSTFIKTRKTAGEIEWKEVIEAQGKKVILNVEVTSPTDIPLTYGAQSFSTRKLVCERVIRMHKRHVL